MADEAMRRSSIASREFPQPRRKVPIRGMQILRQRKNWNKTQQDNTSHRTNTIEPKASIATNTNLDDPRHNSDFMSNLLNQNLQTQRQKPNTSRMQFRRNQVKCVTPMGINSLVPSYVPSLSVSRHTVLDKRKSAMEVLAL